MCSSSVRVLSCISFNLSLIFSAVRCQYSLRGWSGGAMVLGKLPGPGRPIIWTIVGQGPIALAVGAGGGLFGHFYSPILFSPLPPSLWETARYRLKYCLKGPQNPNQPTNQPTKSENLTGGHSTSLAISFLMNSKIST